MKYMITYALISLAALMAPAAATAFDGEVYRGAIQVGSTSIPALCAKSTDIGIQCVTTDAYSKGRVAAGQIDNDAPVMNPSAAVAWAEQSYGEAFRAAFNSQSRYAIIGGVRTEISHVHDRW